MSDATLSFNILTRYRDTGANAAARDMDNLSKSGGRMSRSLKNAAKVGALALAAGAALAGKALFNMGQEAGDLAETVNKVNTIFGAKAGNTLQKWAEDADTALGQSKQTALDAAGTFGTFGKAAGKSGQELAKFAMENTELAADLASFHNSTPEEAIEALGAAFRGEAEPIRKFGILLDDATLRNEALRLGLIKTTKDALTPQQKVLAAQAAIMKQTSDAQGDFARTSGGLANQQRILSAQFANVRTEIGAKVLPVLLKLATFANTSLIPALRDLSAWVEDSGRGARKFGSDLSTRLLPVVQELRPAFAQVANVMSTRVMPIVQRAGAFFTTQFLPALMKIHAQVAKNLKPVFDQLVATFRAKVLPTLDKALVKFRTWQPTIEKVTMVITKVIGKLLVLNSAVLGKVLPVLIRFAGFVFSRAIPAMMNFVEAIAKGIGVAINFGVKVYQTGEKVAAFAGKVREKVASLSGAFTPLVNAFNAVKNAIEAVISALSRIHVPSINLPNIPGMARGGISPGGVTLVGERGPELVNLPRGSRVTPNGQTMSAMRELGGGGGGDIIIPITFQLEGETVIRAVLRYQRRTGKTYLVDT